MARLPDFVAPMLARLGEPFDSDAHLFEVKWDGIRGVALVEDGTLRLRARSRRPMEGRYPELAGLARLPDGTVLDGEVVVLVDDRPSFPAALRREQSRGGASARALAAEVPAIYVAFDLLYRDFEPLLARPLAERREALGELVESLGDPRVVRSDGVVGAGRALFAEAERRGLEGVVAKRLDSPYLPGRRSDAWTKVKVRRTTLAAILGVHAEDGDVRSLVVAVEDEGRLVYAGRVGSGLDAATRARLAALCRGRERAAPLVPAEGPAVWIEPGLYCTVSYAERTEGGSLRAPVFLELHVDEA